MCFWKSKTNTSVQECFETDHRCNIPNIKREIIPKFGVSHKKVFCFQFLNTKFGSVKGSRQPYPKCYFESCLSCTQDFGKGSKHCVNLSFVQANYSRSTDLQGNGEGQQGHQLLILMTLNFKFSSP